MIEVIGTVVLCVTEPQVDCKARTAFFTTMDICTEQSEQYVDIMRETAPAGGVVNYNCFYIFDEPA